MRRVLKAIALGQDPDELEPEEIALVGLHRDGLLASLGQESRRLLEALVEELVCLEIGAEHAPERLAESTIATSAAFADATNEYVELLRSALDADDGLGSAAGLSDTSEDLPIGAVVATPTHATPAAQLLASSVLVALLAPGSDGRDGWIASNRRLQLRSMLLAHARMRSVPPATQHSARDRRTG